MVTMVSSKCTTEVHHRRRRKRQMIAPLTSRKNASPSFVFLFLASLLVGTLLIGNINVVTAEEKTPDESSGSSDSNNDGDDSGADPSPVESCIEATEALLNDDSADLADAITTLDRAIEAFSDSFVSSMTDEEWSFGFSEDSLDVIRDACDYYNDVRNKESNEAEADIPFVIFKELDETLILTCDMPQMKVTGETVSFYGIADCVAATENCRDMTSMDMAKSLWESVGLDCRAATEEGSDEGGNADDEKGDEEGSEDESNSTVEESDVESADEDSDGDNSNEEEENAPEALTPGDNADSSERLPFLTDEDVACIDATSDFVEGNAGLTSAIATYDNTQVSRVEKNGIQFIGYPMEAAMAMKSACELNHGHWAFVEQKNFTCVIEAMETIAVHVHHYGSCLDRIDDCLQMDTTSLLRADLVDMGFNCWEDEDSDNAAVSSGDDTDDTASDGNVEENSSTTQGDVEEGENTDKESDKENDESSHDDYSDDAAADMAELLGLSESDQKCMGDTSALALQHPTLDSAVEEYAQSMNLDAGSVTSMTLTYPDENVAKLRSICTDIDGYFAIIENQELTCSMLSVELTLNLTNVAECLADTTECRDMNILVTMEDVYNAIGLSCQEKGGADEEDANPSSTNTTKPEASDNDHEMDNNRTADDSSPTNDMGMIESDIACMKDSTDFIDSSAKLVNATVDYEKSVLMNDPTKLGFDASSSSEMERICEEEGGLWSFVESQDVTCVINGYGRCINVYNFGNCIAKSDDCQSMDPMVLVKTFFHGRSPISL